jgi:transcriptional regulator NrdR family protein
MSTEEPKILYVIKRNGMQQPIDKEKIRRRLMAHGYGLNEQFINYDVVVEKVYSGIYSGK